MRGAALRFEKTPYFFFGSLFSNQIRGKELKGRAEQAGGASSGSRLGRLPLWSGAIITALTTVENLYSGCKQADGLKSNGGPFKDASGCIFRLRHNCILELLFLRKILFNGISYVPTSHFFLPLSLC